MAHAAREIGLLLGEPGAARGYPPSALATITRLVERAGNSASSILDGHIVLSRVMTDITAPAHQRLAREFRALIASYESNRDLVLMGAHRSGADPQLGRAIAMHIALVNFLSQQAGDIVPLESSVAALEDLLGHENEQVLPPHNAQGR